MPHFIEAIAEESVKVICLFLIKSSFPSKTMVSKDEGFFNSS